MLSGPTGSDSTILVVIRGNSGSGKSSIDQTVRIALDPGYHVVLDGILHAGRYAPMLTSLCHDHRGRTTVFYLDISLTETLRRHQTRPQADQFSAADMHGWYLPRDLFGINGEQVLHESTSLQEAVHLIAATAGLPLHERHDDFLPLDASTPETLPKTPLA